MKTSLIGSRWFHNQTGIEHMVVFLPHDSLTIIVDIESGHAKYWTELGEQLIEEELNKNYHE